MEKIQWIEFQGHKIILEDFSNIEPGEEFRNALDKARAEIHSQPEKSVLALFDATDARFDQDSLSKMKDFVNSNTPYIQAAAVVGVKGLAQVALMAVTRFSKRSFQTCETREEAMAWLVNQVK